MELEYRKGLYLLKDTFFPAGAVLGFSDNNLFGLDLPKELSQVFQGLGIGYKRIVYLNQVHGNDVIKCSGEKEVYTGDGLITQEKGVVLCVRTADCLPVVFYNEESGIIGVIHVGWKPAKAGIIRNFLKALKECDIDDLKNSYLILGPGLRGDCLEVGEEFKEYEEFKGCIYKREDKLVLDIVKFVKDKFIEAGINKNNIYDSGICNMCRDEFYSYRRDKTNKRTISFIIKNNTD